MFWGVTDECLWSELAADNSTDFEQNASGVVNDTAKAEWAEEKGAMNINGAVGGPCAVLRAALRLERDLPCVVAWCGALTRYSGT